MVFDVIYKSDDTDAGISYRVESVVKRGDFVIFIYDDEVIATNLVSISKKKRMKKWRGPAFVAKRTSQHLSYIFMYTSPAPGLCKPISSFWYKLVNSHGSHSYLTTQFSYFVQSLICRLGPQRNHQSNPSADNARTQTHDIMTSTLHPSANLPVYQDKYNPQTVLIVLYHSANPFTLSSP